ncbi:MAG TPA: tRNA guanosine(34) transglycosylase Tgt [Dongiaceae bacterium]|jgi:queuine tRNA-ribosyltransferase
MTVTYPNFQFDIVAEDPNGTRARRGRLFTPHGILDTPAFIFCATKAAMKACSPAALRAEKTQIILSNTYHLMLQPGADLIAKMGGLHRFMGWDGPMLTDSGGFQIFSLGHGSVADEIKGRRDIARPKTLLKISEKGAAFRSYVDGSKHLLTPESSIDIQRKLGADLIVTFDECTPYHSDRTYTERSLRLSNRWGDRCIAEFDRGHKGTQALYGILQGGVYRDLRHEAAGWVNDRPFFGNAVGGTLGGSSAEMDEVVGYAMEKLNRHRPTHLLGIGGFRDIFAGVAQGIDTFDCVSPTRIARHGAALMPGAKGERVNLKNARFREDPTPIDEVCDCYCCRNFSRAYVHHLIKAEELLGLQLLTQHNIAVMNRLMREVQAAIPEGRLDETRKRWVAQ